MIIIGHQNKYDSARAKQYRDLAKLLSSTDDLKAAINLIRSSLFKQSRDDAFQLIDMGRKFLIRALTKVNHTRARNIRRLIELADKINGDMALLYSIYNMDNIANQIVFTVMHLLDLRRYILTTYDNLKQLDCWSDRIHSILSNKDNKFINKGE